MNTRLSQFIDYATNGNRAEFARIVGWSLHKKHIKPINNYNDNIYRP